MRANLEDIVLRLKPEDIIRLERICLDGNEKEALSFLRECIYEKVLKQTGKPHCVPYYELEARKRDGAKNDNPWLDKERKTEEDSE